jgi:hypothetical protein
MPKIEYKYWNPTDASLELVATSEDVIDDYANQGYTLTLRQLYYQLVGAAVIVNTERSYKNLGNLITKARMAGLIDWESIEDRGRNFMEPGTEEDLKSLIRRAMYTINWDRWIRQNFYVEVWVEKEALGNVIAKACAPTDTPYLACKGYLSASEAWRAGRRLRERRHCGQQPVIIHLGDHDPSGLDMTRDNRDRLSVFSEEGVIVERIALNMDLIDLYDPPPNPTKLSDSRAADYIEEYGRSSWELDALRPSVIEELITDKIEEYIDRGLWDESDEEEHAAKTLFQNLYDRWDDVKEFLDE